MVAHGRLLLWRAEIFGPTRIMRQSYRWPQFLRREREPSSFALQHDGNHLGSALQVEDARVQNEVIQVGITRMPVVKRFEIAGALLVFAKDTCLSRLPIQGEFRKKVVLLRYDGGKGDRRP